MPLQIGNLIDGAADNALGRSAVSGILSNPIYTSILITIVIMCIVLYSYRNCSESLEESGTTFTMTALRTTFWVFISSMSLIFIHNRILVSEVNNHIIGGEMESAIDDVTNPLAEYNDTDDLLVSGDDKF